VTVARPATPADRDAIDALHHAIWGSSAVVGRDRVFDLRLLPTLVAERPDGSIVGALCYQETADALEVVSIGAVPPTRGAGTVLLDAAVTRARQARLRRVWLITTNDNLDALRFYQRRGMRIVHVDPGAVDRARRLKPGIPPVGAYGIPLRDELTLELRIDEGTG
jgi:N-acetylglutamate synthase-like GNAT family acetyltransferase